MMPLASIAHTPFLFTGTRGFCLFEFGQKNVTVGLFGMENSGKRTLEQYFQKHALASRISSYNKPHGDKTVLVEGDRRVVIQNALEMGKAMDAADYLQGIENNDALILMMDGCRVLEERAYAASVEAYFHFINGLNSSRKILIPIAAFGDKCAGKFPGDRKLELKFKLENRLSACLSGYNIHDIVLANLLDEHHLSEIKKALFQ